MNHTNNNKEQSNMSEPTLNDLYTLMKQMATREHIDAIQQQITTYTNETNAKIATMEDKVENAMSSNANNNNRIEYLEIQMESLKQDRLKNNICISGVPTNIITQDNTSDAVIAIAKKLGVDINYQNFSSYAVANNKFIIVNFYNYRHKQTLVNKIRVKRSLMVEEVFAGESNGQVYLNDHLTPYFNQLYLMARNAKKEGKLASVTSYGGKIRARKNQSDAPTLITHQTQLQNIIDMEPNYSNHDESSQSFNGEQNVNQPTQTNTKQPGPKSKTSKTDKLNNKYTNINKQKDLKRKYNNSEREFPAKRIK